MDVTVPGIPPIGHRFHHKLYTSSDHPSSEWPQAALSSSPRLSCLPCLRPWFPLACPWDRFRSIRSVAWALGSTGRGHLPVDHTMLSHPKAGTWHRQPLKPPGAVVMPAVTQAAGQETPGVVCRLWVGGQPCSLDTRAARGPPLGSHPRFVTCPSPPRSARTPIPMSSPSRPSTLALCSEASPTVLAQSTH